MYPSKMSKSIFMSFYDILKTKLRELQGSYNLRVLLQKESDLVNLSSNDYLCIAKNLSQKFLKKAQSESLLSFGSSASRSVFGDEIFFKFEELLENLYAPKRALLFNSGYHANLGVLGAFAKLEDVFFLVDFSSHASMFHALLGSKFLRFKHNDLNNLEELLQIYTKKYRHVFVLSEGIFSIDGECCDILGLVKLKKRFSNVILYIDEAHSLLVRGENMLGICHDLGILENVDFIMLAFGKALGSMGGAILCNDIAKQFLINHARTLIFSTALAPINVAFNHYVFLNRLDFKNAKEKLHDLENAAKAMFQKYFNVLGSSQILSLIFSSNEAVIRAQKAAREAGFLVSSFRYPSVPKTAPRLRICLNPELKIEQLEDFAKVL